jgi:hypothetical protein
MRLYPKQQVLLRENMKIAQVVRKIDNKEKWLVSYYDDSNKFKYSVISEMDIIEESEYEIIKRRINTINDILKDL